MRNLCFFAALLCASISFAQPNSINYKALIKDANNAVVANSMVTVQFQILQGIAQNNVYQETHTPTTDANGIIIINIGEGTADSGVFADIDWSADDHFLNTQIDTGSGLTDMGTTAFNAVPYALSAKTAGNVTGLESIDEGNGYGLAKIGRNSDNYGNIGINAVDLSYGWNTSSTYGATGEYSAAFGISASASGYGSTAFGVNSTSSNYYTTAFGAGTIASGNYSTAFGRNTVASGATSTAFGFTTTASGFYSAAFGNQTTASAQYATAFGSQTTALAQYATAFGSQTTASGQYATAFGLETIASGELSTASGFVTTADAYVSTAIGRYNIGGGTADSWVETDNLFEIGNGTDPANKSNALTVLKNGTVTAPSFDLAEITDAKALITKEYADANLLSSGLESIDEGNGYGLVKIGRNPNNYGNVGLEAIDLSYSDTSSFSLGAIGDYSFATGYENEVEGDFAAGIGFQNLVVGDFASGIGVGLIVDSRSSTAVGKFNLGGGSDSSEVDTDPIFEVGNGTSAGNRSNALKILKNGTVTAPSFDISEITDSKALITKEYADANLNNSGLERINEGNGNGLARIGRTAANFGSIGVSAVDLSYGSGTSTVRGATGNTSVAMGSSTTASGDYSTAIGRQTIASESWSTAMGYNTIASGYSSTAMGNYTSAPGYGSTAMGHYTSASSYASVAIGQFNIGGGSATSWNATNKLFEIGNGTNYSYPNNAFTVLKNGNVGINEPSPVVKLQITGGTALGTTNNTAQGYMVIGIESGKNLVFDNTEIMARNGSVSDHFYLQRNGGNVAIGNQTPTAELDVRGSIEYTGTITDTSDERLKENFASIDNVLKRLQQVTGYTYNMKDDASKKVEYGVKAQELQKVFPEMVSIVDVEGGYLGVSYVQLIPVLLEATKEQQTIIEAQAKKIEELEKKEKLYASLEARLSALETAISNEDEDNLAIIETTKE